jgi:hypothetical protein
MLSMLVKQTADFGADAPGGQGARGLEAVAALQLFLTPRGGCSGDSGAGCRCNLKYRCKARLVQSTVLGGVPSGGDFGVHLGRGVLRHEGRPLSVLRAGAWGRREVAKQSGGAFSDSALLLEIASPTSGCTESIGGCRLGP